MTMKKIILSLITFYKKTEPTRNTIAHNLHLTTGECRFSPTCSEYMSQAIEKYGAGKGLWMGTKRILRCNPTAKGGYDPVL